MKQLQSSAIHLFNKDLLSSYARRIVRREFFRLMCSDTHSCVVEEDRLVSIAEHSIAEVIRENDLSRAGFSLKEAFTAYLRRLLDLEVELSEYDQDMRSEVSNRVACYNILAPFELARLEASA